MTTLMAPIVGSQFRPPAALLLQILPADQPLYLEPEPLNEYDPKALKVMLKLSAAFIPEDKLSAILQSTTTDAWEDYILSDSIQLGYIASSTNPKSCKIDFKPSAGNAEFLSAIIRKGQANPLTIWTYPATLTFGMTGQPLAKISLPQSNKEE